MKSVRRYMLPLLTLALIAMGAAMPFFASWMQDGRIGGFQENFLLNTVNLTLRQGEQVSTVLRLVSEVYATVPWDGRTSMTEQEACQAAMDTIAEMDLRGLLPEGDLDYLTERTGMWAEPTLLLGEDGASALVWECYWTGGEVSPCYMMLDDVTGKAIHFLISTPMFGAEDISALYECWISFLTDYYDIEIISAGSVLREYTKYDKKAPLYLFPLQADLKDGLEPCGLELELFDNIAVFNINNIDTVSEAGTTVDVDAGSMLSR